MVAIAITAEAYEAIKATLPARAPQSIGPDGEMRIWLDRAVFDRLRALRSPGESYSDAIVRLAKEKSGEE
jgi:predicted CopG family antitoxin